MKGKITLFAVLAAALAVQTTALAVSSDPWAPPVEQSGDPWAPPDTSGAAGVASNPWTPPDSSAASGVTASSDPWAPPVSSAASSAAAPADPWAAPDTAGTAPSDPWAPPQGGGTSSVAGRVLITFHANGGVGTPPAAISAGAGERVSAPYCGLTRDVQHFVGWSRTADTSEPEYLPGAAMTFAANTTLYAVYAPEYYTVKFTVGENQTWEVLAPGGKPVTTPALPGTYSGWVDEGGKSVDPAATAVWRDRTYTAASLPTFKSGHERFMDGFEDGLFYPDRAITRAQIAKVLYSLLEAPSQKTISFSDMTGGEWYARQAGALGAMGIITPDKNGAFRGNDPITRAEFAVMLSHFVPSGQKSQSFPDVPQSHWAYAAIRDTVAAGLFGGGSDGKFRPDGQLTRAHTAVVLNRLLGRVPDGTTIRKSPNVRIFPDVPTSHWAYDQIMEASTTHTANVGKDGKETWTSISYVQTQMPEGYHLLNGWLYRVRGGRFLRSQSADGFTFNVDGRSTTGNAELDGYLAEIIRTNTNSSMVRDAKLRALFVHVRDHYEYAGGTPVQKGQTGWEAARAVTFFRTGRGDYYGYAAAFYELAHQIGVNAKAVVGTVGSVSQQDHSWVEVTTTSGTWIYDPGLEMAYRRRNDYRWDLCKISYENAPFQYEK